MATAKARKTVESRMVEGGAVAGTAAAPDGHGDLGSLGKDNLDALVKANAALSQGIEAIGQEVMLYARHSLESAGAAARALIAAKTLHDVVAVNSDFVKAAVEGFLASSARLSEAGAKAASEAWGPWTSCLGGALVKPGRPAAA